MPPLRMLLIVWGVLTGVLVLLLIYRSTLSIHEEDQLFLDEAQDHMAREQAEIIRKLDRVTPIAKVLGAASLLLILVIGAMWLWQGFNATP